jgi:hypothetical protein
MLAAIVMAGMGLWLAVYLAPPSVINLRHLILAGLRYLG